MAEVDPDDKSRRRWVIYWYRFDPAIDDYRNFVYVAYDTRREFKREFEWLQAELEHLKVINQAETVEGVSGVVLPAGTPAEVG